MKRKTVLLTVVLTVAMILGSFTSVFAAAPPTQATKDAVEAAGVQTKLKITDEVKAEEFSTNFYNEVSKGKYKLMGAATLHKKLTKDIVIVDTMPEGWWKARRVPGSINQVVGAMNGPEFKILPAEKKALIKKVNKALPKKTVKQYYNKKTKKWQTKKPAKKYLGKTRNKKVVDKSAPIVVYCGFVGCARSHQAAMYLTQQGYKNVYRFAGGISAWVDAGYDIEGTDVE